MQALHSLHTGTKIPTDDAQVFAADAYEWPTGEFRVTITLMTDGDRRVFQTLSLTGSRESIELVVDAMRRVMANPTSMR